MSTAQMTQAAPRMVNDIMPPAMPSPQQATSSTEIEIVNDIPVQKSSAPKSAGFSPIMSAEHTAAPTAADHLLSQASTAVKTQHAAPEVKKSRFGRTKTVAPVATSITEPKPILETVLLVVGCIVACGIVFVMFSSS